MNCRALLLVSISSLSCQLLFPARLLPAQVQSELRSPSSVSIRADSQQKAGDQYELVGHVEIASGLARLTADRVEYNAATGAAVATGNVHFLHLLEQEDLHASRAEYNLRTSTGSFFDVQGSVGAQVQAGSSLLTTTNPFFFTAERVDRIEGNKIQVLNGQLTVCTVPDPTWTFSTARATIQAGVGAELYNWKLRLFNVPVFYFPFLYRSLRRIPRSTGFLMPSVGSNSRFGTVIGDSFFWAINRSADLQLGAEFLSKRGWSQHAEFRLRPSWDSHLKVSYFGVVDRGFGPQKLDQGGRTVRAEGVAVLPRGFRGVLDFNYLSSLTFREAFTQTYTEAVNSEAHAIGFLNKNFDSFHFSTRFSRFQNFQSVRPDDVVSIRHLPQVEFGSVERPLWRGSPLWISWDSSAAAVRRREPDPVLGGTLQTSTIERMAVYPRITLPLEWKGFHLTPVAGFRAMRYGSQQRDGRISEEGLSRGIGEFSVEFAPPALSRAFSGAGPLYRQPFKHVFEPKVTFRSITGARRFADVLLFDEQDRVADTRELELSLTNRLLAKRSGGLETKEVLSWELRQRYYFDPHFGGALVAGQRNIFLNSLDLSSNAFLDGPRRFSPVVSILRFRPSAHYDIEFHQDYDTMQRRFTHGGLVGNARWGQAFASASHFFVRSSPVLSPNFNQIGFSMGYGNLNRVGWNGVFAGAYDVRSAFLQFTAFQMSYNNNCCGISFEYRRFALGPVRNENQFRMAFSLANIGTFGNLKKQERLF